MGDRLERDPDSPHCIHLDGGRLRAHTGDARQSPSPWDRLGPSRGSDVDPKRGHNSLAPEDQHCILESDMGCAAAETLSLPSVL